MTIPSDLTIGEEVSGWVVDRQLEVYPGQTGGFFSRGYIVSKGDQKAFLKAMDLHKVMDKPLQEILDTISQYVFEGKLFELCADSGLSHVVRMLDQGEFIPSRFAVLPNPQFYRVFFIVFELASGGDIRRELNFDNSKTCSWKLHVLHQIAVALKQLHSVGITHQDVKPSNVLVFKEQKKYKLTDLGRSNSQNHSSPIDNIPFPGDLNYSPLEYFYRYVPPEYQDRRIGSDLFLLGSMLSFLYMGIGALTLTKAYLNKEFWHEQWQGTYQDALPFLVDAHSKATLKFKETLDGNKFQNELADIYFQLCHPDPSTRGSPKTRRISAGLGLDRYITYFDRFSKDLEIQERIGKARSVS